MMGLKATWLQLRSSLWFTPTVIVLLSMFTAVFLVNHESLIDDELAAQWPRVLGATAEGSRQMLSAIATSMITVAGVVFSITIVALSLAASQYSPRVLRNFMRDGPTQWVLGVFVGNFAYCILVLRTIRGADDLTFIPSLAVLAGMAYAIAAISFFIYFIHHVAQSIQASAIVARIFDEAAAAIDSMFPEQVAAPAHQAADTVRHAVPTLWTTIAAGKDGYLTAVDADQLLHIACEHDRVVRLRLRMGEFVARDRTLVEVSGAQALTDEQTRRLMATISIGDHRTVEQDPLFGIQQLVDVGVKALSPGINDPTTASMCVDRLGALLQRLATRSIPDPHRVKDGKLRVIALVPDFRGVAILSYEAIIRHSRGDTDVLRLVLDNIEATGRLCADPARRRSLASLATGVAGALDGAARMSSVRLARLRARALARRLRE